MTTEGESYRFGGHQSFALRIAWLPKAARAIEGGDDPFTDPLRGVVTLGLGKNMVQALRVWVEAYGVAERVEGKWRLTPTGAAVLGAGGHDRYLEDEQSLWLLHWRISTLRSAPFFAWELLINRWNERVFTASEILASFAREADRTSRSLSEVSARQHFDVWLHTYLSGRTGRGEEGIDSPLASLGLVRRAGERETPAGRREPLYALDIEPKPTISEALFEYCLHDWWSKEFGFEDTVPLSQVAFGRFSPGRVFRMPESEVRDRLAAISERRSSRLELIESVNQYVVHRKGHENEGRLLTRVYEAETALAEAIDG